MKTPSVLYRTELKSVYRNNTLTVLTINANSVEVQESQWQKQVKQETVPNDPQEYFIDKIIYGKPTSRIILKDINGNPHETRLAPIVELIKKYGVDVGGKIGVKLVWKTDGHMFLDEV